MRDKDCAREDYKTVIEVCGTASSPLCPDSAFDIYCAAVSRNRIWHATIPRACQRLDLFLEHALRSTFLAWVSGTEHVPARHLDALCVLVSRLQGLVFSQGSLDPKLYDSIAKTGALGAIAYTGGTCRSLGNVADLACLPHIRVVYIQHAECAELFSACADKVVVCSAPPPVPDALLRSREVCFHITSEKEAEDAVRVLRAESFDTVRVSSENCSLAGVCNYVATAQHPRCMHITVDEHNTKHMGNMLKSHTCPVKALVIEASAQKLASTVSFFASGHEKSPKHIVFVEMDTRKVHILTHLCVRSAMTVTM